jgi:hypothetical protein
VKGKEMSDLTSTERVFMSIVIAAIRYKYGHNGHKPLSLEEIHQDLTDDTFQISPTSLLRVLQALEEEHFIRKVPVYEPVS